MGDADQPTNEQLFAKFHYQEVKDLTKHFLTLIAATLVLTVSFAEKIVPLATATPAQRSSLGLCWGSLVLSFALAGLGLYQNYLAAEKAHGSIVYDYAGDFKALARRAYLLLDLSAVMFAVALCSLAVAGGLRLFAG